MKRFFLILLASLVGGISASAQHQIHVSTAGVDATADGTAEKPFATLQKAYSKAVDFSGTDTVYINMAPGIYKMEQTLTLNHPSKAPLVIAGCGTDAEQTVISGGIQIGGWEKVSENLWKAQVAETEKYGFVFEQLYVNGLRAIRAKSPDKGWFFIQKEKEYIHYRGNGRFPEYSTQRFTVDPKDLATLKDIDYAEANDIVAMFFHHWDNTRKYLSEIKPDSGYIFTNGKGLKPWNPITKGSRYILENYREALTMPGEWFLDKNGDLYYMPRKGEDMTTAIVYAPAVSTLLHFAGSEDVPVRNISIRNLSFEHSAYVMPKTGNDAQQAAAGISAAIQLDFAENIHFDCCNVLHTGNYGFWFNRSCTDCTLTHSYLSDLGAGGVKIGEINIPTNENEVTRRIRVENNIIQKTGNVFPCGVGVAIFHSSHNKIIHNEISNLMYSGVSIGWIWGYAHSYANNNEVAYNHIHHIGWGELSDMGAVYTLGKSPGTHIHHNVIHDVYSYDYGGWGLYTDEGSSDVVMENNLVYACKSGSFHQHYGENNIIRNNIFAFGQYYQVQLTRVEKHCSFNFMNNVILADCGVMFSGPWDKAQLNMRKNLYWDLRSNNPDFLKMKFKEWEKVRDNKSVLANPQFVAPQQGDFRFKSRSNIRKIDFVPFDYTKAGVYGSDEWKKKVEIPAEEIQRFKEIVTSREKECSSYYKAK